MVEFETPFESIALPKEISEEDPDLPVLNTLLNVCLGQTRLVNMTPWSSYANKLLQDSRMIQETLEFSVLCHSVVWRKPVGTDFVQSTTVKVASLLRSCVEYLPINSNVL